MMNKERLYRFFKGHTKPEEEFLIRQWMDASPENFQEFLNERKLFDASILLGEE
jgi:hypothetical protein